MPLLDELDEINEYSRKFHHSSQNPYADQYAVTDTELKPYVNRTIKIIPGVLGAGVE
jgi:hypothetical protein